MEIGFIIVHNLPTEHPFREIAQQHISFASQRDGRRSDFYYSSNDKFESDQLFTESNNFIIGIDGVILNLKELKNAYQITSLEPLLLHLFEKHQQKMPDHLEGEFCGFIFDKNKERLFVFTNHTGSRKLYYTHWNDTLIVASELQSISQFYKATKVSTRLNRYAAYVLLTFGGMLGNDTLIKGVKRLVGGEYLLSQHSKTEIDKYKDYNQVALSNNSEDQIIADLDATFIRALGQQLEKDREYNYQHIATLSGGLDSRMTVMLANKMGYPIDTFCFSQAGYHDEIIARKIAKDMGRKLIFIPLNTAAHLFDFDENLKAYDGLNFYLNSAHFAYGLKRVNLEKYGLIHTGMIGDGLLGSVLSQPHTVPPQPKSKLISDMLYFKIEKVQRGHWPAWLSPLLHVALLLE